MSETETPAGPGPSVDHYVTARLDDQINHFEKAAGREQRRGKDWQNLLIAMSAVTPLLIGLAEIVETREDLLRGLALLTSALAAIATSIMATRRYWENGVIYRAREEALKREKWLWQQKVGPYAEAGVDPDAALVERVEDIIAADVQDWSGRMREASLTARRAATPASD